DAYSTPGYGFYLLGCEDTSLDGSTATDKYYASFTLEECTECNITNSESSAKRGRVRCERSTGCRLEYLTVGSQESSAAVFRSCTRCYLTNSILSAGQYGIEMHDSTNSTLIGNTVSSPLTCIYVDNSDRTNISDNTANDSSQSGIVIKDSDSCIVKGNEARQNEDHGMELSSSFLCVIEGNIASDNYDSGFYVEGQNYLYGNIAERNRDHGFETALVHDDLVLIENTARDNRLDGFHIAGGQSDSHITAQDNAASANGQHGFLFQSMFNGTLTDNLAVNNVGRGLFLQYCRNLVLYRNGLGWNDEGDAWDEGGENNQWDNGTDTGNRWGFFIDYTQYDIPGSTGATDRFPEKLDTNPPTIDSPPDIYTNESAPADTVTWTPVDAHPWWYHVYRNSSLVESGDWDGSPISMNTGDLPFGTYEFVLLVRDTCNNNISDTVMVYVDDSVAPEPGSPPDIGYAQSTTGHNITWNPVETNPSWFEVTQNGSLIASGEWNGSAITICVDGLPLGTFNFTLMLVDLAGSSASDTVLVTVSDETPPHVESISDILIQQGTATSLIWNGFDLNPSLYYILINGTTVASGFWNSSEETISLDLSLLETGVHNMTIVLSDAGGNCVSDSAVVTVVDDCSAPEIVPLDDLSLAEDGFPILLRWNVSDSYPISYSVTLNSTEIASGSWNGSPIELTLNELELGVYVLELNLSDIGGNRAFDEVLISVRDVTIPTLSHPVDISCYENETGHLIIWNATDDHPTSYRVYHNGTLIQSGEWTDATMEIIVSTCDLDAGTHIFVAEVSDVAGNTASDTVIVTVLPEPSSTSTTTVDTPDSLLLVQFGLIAGVVSAVAIAYLVARSRDLIQSRGE
ncbi:hypothetical protein EU538_12280, partial [Candidatus Thorarchaeota archaeon]